MVTAVINPNKNWALHFSGLVDNSFPIQMKESQGKIIFSFPLDEKETIEIELYSFKKEQAIIEGKYTVASTRYSDKIFFKVIEAGRLLRGTPKGSLSRFEWTISS
jgi:hypothetical protein